MKIREKDIIDQFRITRSLKTPVIHGHFDIREARFNNGGRFADLTMIDGEPVTVSLN